VRAGFRRIHQTILEALQSLGVDARLAPSSRPVGPGHGACFETSAGGEILVAGRKLAGGAQLTQGDALLQHGSLLLQDDQQQLATLTLTRDGGSTPALITLTEAMGRALEFEIVATAVAGRFERWEGARADGRPAVVDRVAAGHVARYRDPEWTWRR
jgi:lipoate-protein ligase A